MNRVELCDKLRFKGQSVGLDERQGVIGLRVNVHADNFKACSVVTDTRATRTAEKIKQARLPSLR
jgi:hypothetical protein